TSEDEYFPLPPSLRSMMASLQAAVELGYSASQPGLSGPLDEDRTWSATDALELLGVGSGLSD
ncbi:MAG: hypothetical protein OEM94_11945, partial [Acidimicrobiia bacterium]|nr:hypothetical protein [Acidimicrobiia bacterium]